MDRHLLDDFTTRYGLSPAAVALSLQLTGLRPDVAAWRQGGARFLHAAGLLAVGTGALFFVAANWQQVGGFGRFTLLECALLSCVAVAVWRPPPGAVGRAALVLATLLTGGLLALFGQYYQTGADTYELFFDWALFSLPFVLAGRSAALWAVWWMVLNTGLALLSGIGPDDVVWRVIRIEIQDRSAFLMVPCLLNLLGVGAWLLLRRRGLTAVAPRWLLQLLAIAASLFGTLAASGAVTGAYINNGSTDIAWVMTLYLTLTVGIGIATWRLRRDVFPLALIAASGIVVSTSSLGLMGLANVSVAMFVVAGWLVATSTLSARVLMHWFKAWRAEGTLA